MVNPKVVVRGGSKSPVKRGGLKDTNAANGCGGVPQVVRKPQPPRVPELKRPLTGKQLDEIKKRLSIEPEEFAAPSMHIVI